MQGEKQLAESARLRNGAGAGPLLGKARQVADDFNPLVVIDRWVESGEAPDYALAEQRSAEGRLVRARRLCPLPAVARFAGGDTNAAGNFACVIPPNNPEIRLRDTRLPCGVDQTAHCGGRAALPVSS